MKHTRRRRHLRPRPSRSQVHSNLRHFENALAALRVEVAFELSRPSPSAERIRWMQDSANFCLDRMANLESVR